MMDGWGEGEGGGRRESNYGDKRSIRFQWSLMIEVDSKLVKRQKAIGILDDRLFPMIS